MKKSYIKNVIALATVMLMSASVVSCDLFEKNDEPEVEPENPVVAYDFSGESKYEISILPPESDVISMIDVDSVGVARSMSSYNALTEEITTFQFDDNGLLRSMGSDSLVVAFSNYNGSLVDVAFVLGEEMYVIKDYDAGISWDELSISAVGPTASRSDLIMGVDEFLVELSEFLQTYEAVIDGAVGMEQIAHQGLAGAPDAKIRMLVRDWLINLGFDAMSPALNKYVDLSIEAISVIHEVKGGANWVGSTLYFLLENYESWSDFCEDTWLTIFEWLDDNYEDDEDLAMGTLDSGYGDLKATLTWDFYADVDLHAVEPSGEHIYYAHKNSNSSDGFLDVDNRAGGSGSTENIYWENPAEGVYEIYIDHYGHSTYNGLTEEGMCKVSIMYKGRAKVYDLNLMEDETKSVGVMSLPDGTIIESRAGDGCIILEIKNLSNTQFK